MLAGLSGSLGAGSHTHGMGLVLELPSAHIPSADTSLPVGWWPLAEGWDGEEREVEPSRGSKSPCLSLAEPAPQRRGWRTVVTAARSRLLRNSGTRGEAASDVPL